MLNCKIGEIYTKLIGLFAKLFWNTFCGRLLREAIRCYRIYTMFLLPTSNFPQNAGDRPRPPCKTPWFMINWSLGAKTQNAANILKFFKSVKFLWIFSKTLLAPIMQPPKESKCFLRILKKFLILVYFALILLYCCCNSKKVGNI